MTALLCKGEAARLAVRTAYEAARRRLRRELGLPEAADLEELGQAARRVNTAQGARLQTALEHCQEAIHSPVRVSEAQAVALVRELDEAEKNLSRL